MLRRAPPPCQATSRAACVSAGPILMGRDWLRFTAREQARCVEEAFEYWRRSGFPYIRLSQLEIDTEISWLMRAVPSAMISGGVLCVSTVGLRLANSFHPQMWHVPVHDYKTPFDRYQDDFCLRDCIRKALQFFPDRIAGVQ